jgi:uncharacterized protein
LDGLLEHQDINIDYPVNPDQEVKMKLRIIMGISLVFLLAAACISLSGCSTNGAAAQDLQPVNVTVNSSQQGILVNGEGKITVTPDIATVSLGVSAQASTVAAAQSQASTAMDKVIAALTGNGIAKNDIRTQYFNIQQQTRYDNNTQQSVVTGYMVSNTVSVKIRAVDKTGPIIDAVAVAGGDNTRINGVSFSVEKPEQYNSQVRELAVKDAKSKADEMAKLAGVTLGKATYISEGSVSSPIPYAVPTAKLDASGGGSTTSISPGQTDITLDVQINYAIQ